MEYAFDSTTKFILIAGLRYLGDNQFITADNVTPAYSRTATQDTNTITVPADADYAAVSWGVENGITNGYGDTFRPGNTCTRAEIVTFLHRAYVYAASLIAM